MTLVDNLNILRVTYQGEVNCYLVHKTLEHCNCSTCKGWISREKAEHFLDDTRTFGYISLKKDDRERSFYLCPTQTFHMSLVSQLAVKHSTPMTMVIRSGDQASTWKDQLAVGSKIYGTVSIKVHSHVVQNSPLVLKHNRTRSPSKLKLTFRGPQKSCLIFSTTSKCRCDTCKAWIRCETLPFLDTRKNKYGLVTFEQVPLEIRTFDFCWNHIMKVTAVQWSSRHLFREQHLQVILKGWKQGAIYRDIGKIGTGTFEIRMEIYSASDMLPHYSEVRTTQSTSLLPEHPISGPAEKGQGDPAPSKHGETKQPESLATSSSGGERHHRRTEVYDDELPEYHEIDDLSSIVSGPSSVATMQSIDPHSPSRSWGYIPEYSWPPASASSSSLPARQLRIKYVGSRKGLLVFHTKFHCNCVVCNDWTSLQLTPFKKGQGTYGVIPFERRSEERVVDICPTHTMAMGVVPWSDRYCAEKVDMSLEVSGQHQNKSWRDVVGDDVDFCKVTLKVCAITLETKRRSTTMARTVTNGAWTIESELTFRGRDSCYRAFQAKVDCGCTMCEFWKAQRKDL